MCHICEQNEINFYDYPKNGDLKVWWIPQVPMGSFDYPVKSIREAKLLLSVLADYYLFQFYHKVKPDFSNAGGLQVYDEKEKDWIEWENEDGLGIDDVDENGNTIQ